MGLSYCTYALLVTRPFIWYHFLPLTLKFDLLTSFHIGDHFQIRRDGAFILHVSSLRKDFSPSTKSFDLVIFLNLEV